MDMKKLVARQREYFNSGATKNLAFIDNRLIKLEKIIVENEYEINAALKQDLGKSGYEAFLTETSIVLNEIKYMRKNLKKLWKPAKKHTPITHLPAQSYTVRQPHGVVLILSPWNYPVHLALAPLVGAIAGGNCVVLKCSTSSYNTSKLMCTLINEAFEDRYIHCVSEGVSYDEINTQKYDFIFFTGSPSVGKKIMHAAAENLTPVCLELGGKSPCFVDKNANIALAAKRIIWGKSLNSGQTCVAPDYVLVDARVKDKLIEQLELQIYKQFGNCLTYENWPKIISSHHFDRLCGLIDRHENKIGGDRDKESQKIAMTIMDDVTFDSEIMEEEIFGPILPVIAYDDINQTIKTLKNMERPLACYIFTRDKDYSSRIIDELHFGGGCINDVIMHIANHSLPFGGVGNSGMGSYHTKYSFDTFTREKSILKNKEILDMPFRYHPYNEKYLPLIRKIMGL